MSTAAARLTHRLEPRVGLRVVPAISAFQVGRQSGSLGALGLY